MKKRVYSWAAGALVLGSLGLGWGVPAQAQSQDEIVEMLRQKQGAQQQSGAPAAQPASQPQYSPAEEQNTPAVLDTSEWKAYSHKGCFVVSLPSKPNKSTTEREGMVTTTWTADSGDPMHLFEVSMSQTSGLIPASEIDGFLFTAMNSRAKELGARPRNTKRIQNNERPGCMFEVVCDDSAWDFMIRISGDKIYTFSCCSNPGEENDGYAKHFFQSIKLL